jgi:predicted nucleotidyltransferase
LPERLLDGFCRRWRIAGLRLVGSALHGPFLESSDVDLLVSAPITSPIYGFRGQVPFREAAHELTRIIGRKVDLICPRRTLASANPYAIYNLLVEHKFERHVGLAWYLHSAADLLSHAALADPEQALVAMPGRHLMLSALLRLARTCDTEARVSDLSRRGLGAVPFASVRTAVGPVLASVRALETVRWPNDTTLANLVRELTPHLPRILDVASRTLPTRPPEIGDPPALQDHRALVQRHDVPTFTLTGEQLVLDRTADGEAHPTWCVLTLTAETEALTDPDELSFDGLVCLAPMHQPVYVIQSQIDRGAMAALRSLVQRDVRVLVRQQVLMAGRRTLLCGVLIQTRFSAGKRPAWPATWNRATHDGILAHNIKDAHEPY